MTESRAGSGDGDGFGRLLVERSGGIGGMRLVWEVDIDASSHAEGLGRTVAELPWSAADASSRASTGADGSAQTTADSSVPTGADRFVYLIESRYGRVRFGEAQMPQEWKRLVDEVREVTEPQRRPPG
ncbi:protealysin inhibitor emfourin [Brevibacterium spongiae]|uniref:Uncharacterized protein n=1 Tax=Brevibacterium spongiae TaxID=2909672 RepID=A0ABY5SMU8_9MICO|nr:protealysin inhibitor emfourin [Brevibacterium spongiae]UVI35474.1 hypothetical protein L1F31_15320 [Brevibacterium spongiae]